MRANSPEPGLHFVGDAHSTRSSNVPGPMGKSTRFYQNWTNRAVVVPVDCLQVTLGRHYLTTATEDRLRNETRQLPVLAPDVLDDALHVFGVPFACERKSVSKSWRWSFVALWS